MSWGILIVKAVEIVFLSLLLVFAALITPPKKENHHRGHIDQCVHSPPISRALPIDLVPYTGS
jgi:hypothetical protein